MLNLVLVGCGGLLSTPAASAVIRGRKASAALADLQFSRKRIAVDVKKCLESAIANAENNHDLDVDALVVAEASVGKSITMKRFHTRGRGKSTRILKPFIRLRIVVREVLAPVALPAMQNAPAGTLLVTGSGGTTAYHLKVGSEWRPASNPAGAAEVVATLAADTPRIVTLLVVAIDADGENLSFEGMGFDRTHPAWVGHVMSATPSRRADHLQNMFAITIGGNVSALELRNALFAGATPTDRYLRAARGVIQAYLAEQGLNPAFVPVMLVALWLVLLRERERCLFWRHAGVSRWIE